MDNVSYIQLREAVQSQASIRLKLGVPVAAAAMGLILFAQREGAGTLAVGAALVVAYALYAAVVYFISKLPLNLSWRNVVLATAVLDPLLLSAWLWMGGEEAMLVMAFYLFTILGFGFRIGPRTMRLCQLFSILGFAVALMSSPFWREHPWFGVSHMVLLIVVPMYAGKLMKELRKARAQAESESRAKSQLLANVSHELRTPLTGIVSAAELVEHQASTPEVARLARSIVSLSNSLDNEIGQLLDLSRIGAQPSAPPGPFQLQTALATVETALAEQAAAKGLAFTTDIDPSIKYAVMGRLHEMTSVLMNLAGNAVKFTHDGAVSIQIRLLSQEDEAYRLWIGVKDTGIGISEEHQERLFEPFYRVEGGDVRKYRGTGLGTTIANEHVRRMGSELKCASQPGEGSTFWFEVTMQTSRHQLREEPGPAPHIVAPKSILIADDNHLNLELLQQMLAKDGHLVIPAKTGSEALEQLVTGSFDLVMLDFNMGDVDGLTVYQMYRFGKVNAAPVLFITADTSVETASKLNSSGAAGVIYKPLTFGKLRGALATIFPDVSETVRQAAPQEPAAVARLAPVPIEHVDPGVLDTLREIKDSPAFIYKIIGDGITDIEQLLEPLSAAIMTGDLAGVHQRAHAMKGVAVNIGALRLGAQCERLMRIRLDQLLGSKDRQSSELQQNARAAVSALQDLRMPFSETTSRTG